MSETIESTLCSDGPSLMTNSVKQALLGLLTSKNSEWQLAYYEVTSACQTDGYNLSSVKPLFRPVLTEILKTNGLADGHLQVSDEIRQAIMEAVELIKIDLGRCHELRELSMN